jgi:hypothetical protein
MPTVCGGCGSAPPEFSVLLNDLPTNDFSAIFSHVPEFAGKLTAEVFLSVWRPGIILREAISYQKRALGLLKNGIAAQAVVLRAKENQARVGYE